MRFAIYVPCYGESYGDPAVLCSLAVEAEAAGWDGFFLWDHVVVPDEPVVADVWVTLGAVAADVEASAGAVGDVAGVSGVRFAPVEVPIWVGGNWPRSAPFRAAEHAAGVVPATFGLTGWWCSPLRTPLV